MYLVALHVVRGGAEGINAFHYRHADLSNWDLGPPPNVPDENPGVLVNKVTLISPGGNRVRSSLDITARDDEAWVTIRMNFVKFVLDNEGKSFPWVFPVNRCVFRAAMENALAAEWRRELVELYEAIRSVRV